MPVVGFGFTKLSVERKNKITGQVNIKNNTAITSVEKDEISLGTQNQPVLKFGFNFGLKYEPEMANIVLEGEVIWADKPDKIESTLKEWEKEKKVGPTIMTPVLNTVLQKCNIQALILSKDLNLPAPIQLPKVSAPEDLKKEQK